MPGPQLMQRAMAEGGRLAQRAIAADLDAFAGLGLTGAERLSALAGAIAAVTAKRHAATQARFLDELHALTRPCSGVTQFADRGAVGEQRIAKVGDGIRLLDAGFDRLAATLAEAGLAVDSAGAVEAVLLARLLGGHRPHRVRLALLACAVALAAPDYRPGDLVPFLPAEGESPAVAAPLPVAATGTFG
jgi:hypothetical protein